MSHPEKTDVAKKKSKVVKETAPTLRPLAAAAWGHEDLTNGHSGASGPSIDGTRSAHNSVNTGDTVQR